MSWEIALVASKVASTAIEYIGARNQAAYAEGAANIQAQAAADNKEMARIQALQEENDRQREFDILRASNENQTSYDPQTSPSFLALGKQNKKELADDIANIRLLGAANANRYELERQSALIDAKSARSSGKLAAFKAAAKLGETAYEGHKAGLY